MNKLVKFKTKKLFVYLILSLFVIWMVGPFIWMVSTSLKHLSDVYTPIPQLIPRDKITGQVYITLENYRYVIELKGLGRAFFNSLLVAIAATVFKLFFDSLAAYAFARIRFPGRNLLFFIVISSMMVPGVAILVPRVYITKLLGLYNSLWGLIIPMSMSVFNIFLLRQFFLNIPVELEEASMIDGASRWTIYWRIALPLTKPALALVAISSFAWHWNDLMWPLVILTDVKKYTLPLALALLASGQVTRPHYVMAGATLTVIPIMIIFLIFQRQILEGISTTGLNR